MVTSPLYFVSLVMNSEIHCIVNKTQSHAFSDNDTVLLSIFMMQNELLNLILDKKNNKTYNLGCTVQPYSLFHCTKRMKGNQPVAPFLDNW